MKYLLTPNSITVWGRTLYQIRALTSFGDVSAGEYGGYIESEACLSQSGDCWVYPPARVLNHAKVYENGKLRKGLLHGNARLYGNGNIRWTGRDSGCYGDATFGLFN